MKKNYSKFSRTCRTVNVYSKGMGKMRNAENPQGVICRKFAAERSAFHPFAHFISAFRKIYFADCGIFLIYFFL